jgi:hypothetical protein
VSTYHAYKAERINVKHALKTALNTTLTLSAMQTVIMLDVSLLRAQHSKAPMSTLALVVKGDVDDLV